MTRAPDFDMRTLMEENLPLIHEARQRRRAAGEEAGQLAAPVREWMLTHAEERLERDGFVATLQRRARPGEFDPAR